MKHHTPLLSLSTPCLCANMCVPVVHDDVTSVRVIMHRLSLSSIKAILSLFSCFIFHHIDCDCQLENLLCWTFVCPGISPVVDIYLNNSVNRTNVYFCLILLFNWSVKFYHHRQTPMPILTLGVIR